MANEIYVQQRNGSNGPFTLRKLTPLAGDVLQFDANKKLVSGASGGATALAAVDGAITPANGNVMITKASAAALTLAAPTTAQNGMTLTITSTTAFAHTVTNTTPGFNNGGAASDVATYGAQIGNFMTVRAYAGVWYVLARQGITLA